MGFDLLCTMHPAGCQRHTHTLPSICHPLPWRALQEQMSISSIQLTVGAEVKGAFIFVGDASTNNGMDNPVCAMVRAEPAR